MECMSAFSVRMFAEALNLIASYNDGRTVAQMGSQDVKEGTRYIALLATTDETTTRIASARGYAEQPTFVCSIGGRPAKVFIQIHLGLRV